MTLTLYSNYVNSAGERVRIAMALKGVDYDYVSVSHIGRKAYREINPQGLMPAISIDGKIVQQATASLEWLEEILRRRDTAFPCCFSETPGWADLHLAPQVQKGLTRFNVDMAEYRLISGIYDICKDHPAFIAAKPQNQPDWPGQIVEPVIPLE
ncbi:MAG: glutathione S-transferase N-terminal domain-containing protein [Pseudomonadota bacterium]